MLEYKNNGFSLEKRLDIQVLRALAVLVVVIFHLDKDILPLGYLGVDIFFVISGYVITRGLIIAEWKGKKFYATTFLSRRLARLFPALLTTVIATFFAVLFLYSPEELIAFATSAVYALTGFSNVYFFSNTSYFSAPLETIPLLHTWSLSVEEQFYIFFSFVLSIITLKGKVASRTNLFTWFLLFWFSLGFYLYIDSTDVLTSSLKLLELEDVNSSFNFFMLPGRLWQLSLGVITCLLASKDFKLFKVISSFWVWLSMFFFLVALILLTDVDTKLMTVCVTLLTALLLFQGEKTSGLFHHVIFKWAGKIGDRSYSLYLVHWPVIVLTSSYIIVDFEILDYIFLITCMLLLMESLYQIVEKRSLNPSNNDEKSKINGVMIYTAFFLFSFFFFTIESAGLPLRLGDRLVQYEMFKLDGSKGFHQEYYGGVGCKRDKICKQGIDKAQHFTLLGDSHARQYYTALAEMFDDSTIVSQDLRCRPILNGMCVNAHHSKKVSNFKKKDKIMTNLKCESSVYIVAQMWRVWRSGTVDQDGYKSKFDNDTAYVAAMAQGVKDMIESNENCKFIVIGEVPKTSKNSILDCMFSPIVKPNCFSSSLESIGFIKNLNDTLAISLKKYENAIFINPMDFLCKDGKCFNVIDDLPIYSDPEHLSIWGGGYVLQNSKNKIEKLIGQ